MCEVVKVLERELDNSGLIYIYQEGDEGKWYVYERSAYFLSRIMTGISLTLCHGQYAVACTCHSGY